MFGVLYLTILLCAICFAMPTFDLYSMSDNNEMENIRMKRSGFLGGYNPYSYSEPYVYKIKTPNYKIKIKSGNPSNIGQPPHGIPNTIHPPYGAGAFHPLPNLPYGYHHSPYGYGYGWHG
ncbi:unnamed protein product [Acanthocheilonema viteae]|uniref:Uncharacterized protein n=1 Tax=Acanthocheilonema viteae TaxID=6277 RepID=A0A498SDT6_ACAVI|nr:unnamed protein product [Acanthocheilonema viteae]